MSRLANLGDLESENTYARMGMNSLQDVPMKYCDSIYASETSVGFKPECQTLRSLKYQQAFTSLATNASITLNIPNISIVDSVFVSCSLAPGAIPVNYYCPRSLLAVLCDRIEYSLGGSMRYVIDNVAHWLSLVDTAHESQQKDALVRLAGNSVFQGPNANPLYFQMPVYLPFTRAMFGDPKLPLDLKLLSQPVQITIYWKSGGLASVVGGAGTGLATQWASGYWSVSQIDFKTPDHSLARDIMLNPMATYIQPCLFTQQSQIIPCTTSNVISSPVSVNLQGIRFGDLTSICLFLVKNVDINGASATAAKNPFASQKLGNIQLVFNGVIIYKADARVLDLQHLGTHKTPNFFEYEVGTGTTSPFGSGSPAQTQSYYYVLDLAQLSDIVHESSLVSGLEVGSGNVLNLQFNTLEDNGNAATLYAVYRYPMGIKISQQGMAVDYVF